MANYIICIAGGVQKSFSATNLLLLRTNQYELLIQLAVWYVAGFGTSEYLAHL